MLQKLKQNLQQGTQKLLVKIGKAEQTQDPDFDTKAALIQKLSEDAKSTKKKFRE